MYCSLADIIGDICMGFNPGQVYGFFAGEPVMSGSGAKYRYFYTEGIKKALQKGFKPARLGCFYREGGRGTTAILGALGRGFSCCLASGLDYEDVIRMARSGFWKDKEIVIGYHDLSLERGTWPPVPATPRPRQDFYPGVVNLGIGKGKKTLRLW